MKTIEQLTAAVAEASKEYVRARELELAAARNSRDFLVVLNTAQQALDEALAAWRDAAPPESDWHRVGRG